MKITNNNGQSNLLFYVENSLPSGIIKIADKVRLDVQRVTGAMPEYAENLNAIQGSIVIFAYPDNSPAIRQLELEKKIDLSNVRGKREVYSFSVIETPFFERPDIESAVVICGSDKRGLIYGLFHLSELMGVSPLVDWADVMPVHQDTVQLDSSMNLVTKEPSVKYRGFFINDEWPATGNWCNKRFGGFNAQMYEHVFELLLRMKGNYLWPAMWSGRFSDDGPGLATAELADELGVIMGASHHEPCCRAGEEYRYLRGKGSVYGDAWNFRSNKEGITKFWEDGLIRNGKFENVITVGMRGEADTAIMANATLKDNIKLLRDVIKTQNKLIKQYVNEDLDKVPRMLALYKEVEPYFYGDKHTKGLMDDPELDGVTLMLCDDNHGNLRTVPAQKMRSHKGGYGMYYHFDYHGSPFSYEWINSTALPKVKEQMCAAYDFGIQDLWIVNVGDVMTNEFPLNYFLDLAYDYEKYSASEYTTQKWTKEWIDFNFPGLTDEQKSDVDFIINTYTKLAHMRRPECIQPDTYHPVNFAESDRMLEMAEAVISKAAKLYAQKVIPCSEEAKITLGWADDSKEYTVPETTDTGLFAQVIYPAMGTMNVLRMQLYSGKNKWFAAHGCLVANDYAEIVKKCYAFDKILVDEYDRIADGKFYAEGWSEHFGFENWCEAASHYPTYTYVEPTRKGRMIAFAEGCEKTTTGQDWTDRNLYIDAFKNPEVKEACVYIANCSTDGVSYKVTDQNDGTENDFISNLKIEKCDLGYGLKEATQLEKLIITIDREKLAASSVKKDVITIEANDGHGAGIKVFVNIDADVPCINYPAGTYVQLTDTISMAADGFVNKQDGVYGSHFEVLPDYGKTDSAVKAYPVTISYENGKGAPYVEYTFVPKKSGVYAFNFYLNPSNPAYKDNKLQFIVEINGKKLLKDVVDSNFAVGDHQEPWGTDVTNNIRISTVYEVCKDGLNVLRLYPVTPNVVLEKIVIHDAEYKLPESYLGAPETYRVK